MTDPRRSLASPLAALYWLLVVYASLHPFSDWSVPPLTPGELLRLPHTYSGWLDRTINITGYLPLGFLLATAWVRQGWRRSTAGAAALAFASLTSYAMEVTQSFLPARVPSVLDWINNSLGAAAGVALALAVERLGVFDALKRSRRRWLTEHSTPGLLLLLLWPVGLLFPPTVPWVEGQFLPHALEVLHGGVAGTPAQQWLPAVLLRGGWIHEVEPASPATVAMMSLGLLAPVAVAYCIGRAGWPRLLLLAGCVALSVGIVTVSTALNFGPDHAGAWVTAATMPALSLAVLVGLLAARRDARSIAAAGLLATLGLTVWINTYRDNSPFYALSLQAWEQGTFIRFFGLAQWVGWLWPYAAMVWLARRVASPGAAPEAARPPVA
jgi:VanZ family protein